MMDDEQDDERMSFFEKRIGLHANLSRTVSIAAIALMNSVLILSEQYVLKMTNATPSTLMVQSETIKLVVSLCMARSAQAIISWSTFASAVPAVLFQSSALIQLQALIQLPAAVYQALLQSKIAWTMLFSAVIMRRTFALHEVATNLQVLFCAVLFVHQIAPRHNQARQDVFYSSLVIIGTGCSSAASVVCEKLLKEEDGFYTRNAQLALGALVVQAVYCASFHVRVDVLHGSLLLYLASCYDAFYGLCVSMFLKRFDAMSKSMCIVLSMCITFWVNWAMGVVSAGVFDLVSLFACVTAVSLAVSPGPHVS